MPHSNLKALRWDVYGEAPFYDCVCCKNIGVLVEPLYQKLAVQSTALIGQLQIAIDTAMSYDSKCNWFDSAIL